MEEYRLSPAAQAACEEMIDYATTTGQMDAVREFVSALTMLDPEAIKATAANLDGEAIRKTIAYLGIAADDIIKHRKTR